MTKHASIFLKQQLYKTDGHAAWAHPPVLWLGFMNALVLEVVAHHRVAGRGNLVRAADRGGFGAVVQAVWVVLDHLMILQRENTDTRPLCFANERPLWF